MIRNYITGSAVCFYLLVNLTGGICHAVDIEVVKPGAGKITVSLSGWDVTGEDGRIFVSTLREDLQRSGWFNPVPSGGAIQVDGSLEAAGGGLRARLNVVHSASGRSYLSKRLRDDSTDPRRLAHQAADEIVMAVKGLPGIAATRIAMVGNIDGRKDIYVCDYDGRNLVRLTDRGAVCLSPTWTPDASALLFTSFHGGFPDVYMLEFDRQIQRRVAAFPGINAGASVSPDGRNLALALSKDGSPDIYTIDMRNNATRRITATRFAEASPSWSPDGRQLAFVSDRTGRPQVYVINLHDGSERRISFQGRENVAPDWGPDGRIVYSSRRDGRYQICIWSPDGATEQLTSGNADYEDPSWAPNGRHIVCSRTVNFRSEIYILDSLGDDPVRLSAWRGEWYSPAWSPR